MNLEKAVETAKILFPNENWAVADYSSLTDCYFVLADDKPGVMCLILGDFSGGQLYLTNFALSRYVDEIPEPETREALLALAGGDAAEDAS